MENGYSETGTYLYLMLCWGWETMKNYQLCAVPYQTLRHLKAKYSLPPLQLGAEYGLYKHVHNFKLHFELLSFAIINILIWFKYIPWSRAHAISAFFNFLIGLIRGMIRQTMQNINWWLKRQKQPSIIILNNWAKI